MIKREKSVEKDHYNETRDFLNQWQEAYCTDEEVVFMQRERGMGWRGALFLCRFFKGFFTFFFSSLVVASNRFKQSVTLEFFLVYELYYFRLLI